MFYSQLKHDMNTAIEGCNSLTRSGQDLPTKLKIASISTRFNNLKHEGDKLLVIFVTKPLDSTYQRRNSKIKSKRSDSASASELAIKQTLANLQSTFASYKKAFERRLVSHRAAAQTSSPKQSDGSGGKPAVLFRTRSELKYPTRVETSPSHGKSTAGESNHIERRANTYTSDPRTNKKTGGAEKDSKSAVNAVKDKVASFNKRAQEEEQIQMPKFGITFDTRPRAKTADPSVGRNGAKTSPRHRAETKVVAETPTVQEKTEEVKVEVIPSEVASVPLRRKKGRGQGMSKDERKQKIAAIRELFETSDFANIMSEPGKQWRQAGRENVAAKRTPDSVRKVSQGSAASVMTDSSNLQSESVASLPEVSRTAPVSSTSSFDGGKTKGVVESPKQEAQQMSKNGEVSLRRVVNGQADSNDDAFSREQATSLNVVVSPPPETRARLHTAPAIYKTVVKDLSPSKKQVITLKFDQPSTPASTSTPPKAQPSSPQQPSEKDIDRITVDVSDVKGGSLGRNIDPSTFTRDTRATRSMSPQHRRRLSIDKDKTQTSPGRGRRQLLLQVTGKVSSLRNMFDTQAQTNIAEASPAPPRKRSSSESKWHQVKVQSSSVAETATDNKSVHQRSSSMDISIRKAAKAVPPPVKEEPSPSPPEKKRELSPDIISIVKPQPIRPTPSQKESPLTSSITESTSPHPPPRPHSPIGYLLENEDDSGSSDIDFDSDGSIYDSDTSSLDDVDLEWVGGEDEVDLPWGLDETDSPLAEQRTFKSLR